MDNNYNNSNYIPPQQGVNGANPYMPDPNYIPPQPGVNGANPYVSPQQGVNGANQYMPDPNYIPPQQGVNGANPYVSPQPGVNGANPYVQPQGMGGPGSYMPNQNYVAPQQPGTREISPEDIRKGNILCFISMACMFGVPILSGLIGAVVSSGDIENSNSALMSIISLLAGGSDIAAWVLVIIARARYKNKFSKVLLIIYIVILALAVIAFIILILACASCVRDC